MKVQANQVEEFIRSFDSKIKGILVYGPDIGLVSVRQSEILNKILPNHKNSLSLIKISSSNLKEKPSILSDEYNSMSLFGNDKKVITIADAENSLSKNLEEIFFKKQNTENFIIVTAGDLDSKSTLKKFAENNEQFAAIPCYKDDINSIIQLANSTLKKNGFKYNQDVVKYLAESFGGNRLIIINELEKLMIYKDTNKDLTIEDVRACIQDNSEANLNNFINNFASLNIDKAYKELQNLNSESVFPITIIRSVVNYFMKLQLYKYQIQNGLSFNELVTKERVFWKQKPILQQHLQKLSMKNINKILFILLKEECKLKGKIE